MITRSDLKELWKLINPHQGKNVGRRADVEHPLDFFITLDEKSRKQLVLLTKYSLSIPVSSKEIDVRKNKRPDGKYAIGFSLIDEKLNDLFISLCWDLIDCTYDMQDKQRGSQAAVDRFRLWQKMFASNKENKLSESQRKGLFGELYVLKELCLPAYGKRAVGGWVGPIGADRDFEYHDTWIESKYTSLSKAEVRISSLDQLDIDRGGFLIVCRAEEAGENAPDSISINELIRYILEYYNNDENVRTSFMNKLTLYGYRENDDSYDNRYRVSHLDYYEVDDTFPRLRRSAIDVAISNGNYTISLPAVEAWKKESVVLGGIGGGENADL